MRIAIIGPGIMPIPPTGWGAVEILIWNYKLALEALGHEVVIFNQPNLVHVADQLNRGSFDFIHCQYDDHVGFLNDHLKKPFVCTSHYGWLTKKGNWDGGYHRIFAASLKAPGVIALSQSIEAVYLANGYKGYLTHLRNGCETSWFRFEGKGNGKAICLGKIEPRKKQVPLSNLCKGKWQIDFVGQIVDSGFKENSTCRYLGTWDKKTLYERLTDYSCLVLLSDGEAAPLVVPEALAAGLSLVVSDASSANLCEKEYISVAVDGKFDEEVVELIAKQCRNNHLHRGQIREYAQTCFDWKVIAREYETIIDEFRSVS